MNKWLVVGYCVHIEDYRNLEVENCSKAEALLAYKRQYPSFVITNIIDL